MAGAATLPLRHVTMQRVTKECIVQWRQLYRHTRFFSESSLPLPLESEGESRAVAVVGTLRRSCPLNQQFVNSCGLARVLTIVAGVIAVLVWDRLTHCGSGCGAVVTILCPVAVAAAQ